MEKLAESYYEPQKAERGLKIAEDFKRIGANFPCLYGELPIGGSDSSGIYDGHKFLCGLQLISGPPIVYSYGSHKDDSFERAVLAIRPDARIFVFEINPDLIPTERHPNINYFPIGLGGWDGNFKTSNGWELKTMRQVMMEFNHSYIDIVKMDIEGAEFPWLRNEAILVNRIGQLAIEVHIHRLPQGENAISFIRKLEEHGLRVFHQEFNRHASLMASELALIQSSWINFEVQKSKFMKIRSPLLNFND